MAPWARFMGKRFNIDWHSLTPQIVLSFVALVLLMALAVGLPAAFVIHSQAHAQAWAQVSQAEQATQTFYAAAQSRVADLATLTAQRPTLQELVAQGQTEALPGYLQTLQAGAELDLLQLCDANRQPVAPSETANAIQICQARENPDFYLFPAGEPDQAWLMAAEPIREGSLGWVVAGIALDDDFLGQIQNQTGLVHTLLANGRPLASSLDGGVDAWAQAEPQAVEVEGIRSPVTFDLNGQPYNAARLALVEGTLVDEIALNVAGLAATERRLILHLAGSIALVALVGSALGALLARRISRPLTQLAGAARQLSAGHLDQRMAVQSQITEVAQLTESLERARIDLQKSLNELRQAKEWTDNLLGAISEAIVTLDQDGRITFFSPGAERITGWRQEEVLGQPCDQVFRPVGSDAPFSRFLPPPGRESKIAVALPGDRQAILSVTGARLTPPNTDQAGVALVFRDVSESELVHRLMGEFLANITHEFRTPLTALAASAELLFDQAHDLSREELDELLISLHLGIVGLQTLVDNLLEGARLEIGQFRVRPRPADLAEIIGEATRIMRPLQDKHHQRLVVELPVKMPMVQADSRRIVQVLVNLLSNAIKYSPNETEIAIRATAADGWVRLSVSDQGPGIPVEYRSTLFRRFAHPETSSGKGQYGAGLGLSVVKAIVEAHGGQVGLEDCLDGGCTFWFTLPMLDGS